MIRLLITGTGRCGTMYMSKLLTNSGIPCGHEDVFTAEGFKDRPELEAESSWIAAPWLGLFTGTVVHLVRHPLEVVRAFVGSRFFKPGNRPKNGYGFFERWVQPSGDEVADAMRHYLAWNRMIEPRADVRVRIEDQPDASFLADIGADGVADAPHDTNHRKRRKHVAALPAGALRDEVAEMAARYGYAL